MAAAASVGTQERESGITEGGVVGPWPAAPTRQAWQSGAGRTRRTRSCGWLAASRLSLAGSSIRLHFSQPFGASRDGSCAHSHVRARLVSRQPTG